ncbi:hypothetical protein PMI42_00736 [Bradyrhizobium sp. YR681]|nr:hypothetical protein PMI42_00736 [Bradyrhizobium sp. YR681]
MTEPHTKAAREELQSYIDRVERIEEERKALGDDKKAVFAEAASRGFDVKSMRRIIRRRKIDPNDLAEAESVDAVYMHALGMAEDSPLHEQVKALAQDGLGRDQLIETLQLLIPNNGEIIARVGGKPMRLWRDETGKASAEEYVAPEPRRERPSRLLDSDAVEATIDGGRKSHVLSAADRAERRSRGVSA